MKVEEEVSTLALAKRRKGFMTAGRCNATAFELPSKPPNINQVVQG